MTGRFLADRRFWVSSGVIFVDETLYTALVPLLPLLAAVYGLSGTAVGLVVAGYPLLFFLAAMPTGLAVDRIGVRTMLLAGTAMLIVSSVHFAVAESAATVFAARCMQGFASGITSIAGMVAVSRSGAANLRGSIIGASAALSGLSTFAGPVLGGYVAPLFGFRTAFLIPAGLGVLLLALIAVLRWERPGAPVRGRLLPSPATLRDPFFLAGLTCIGVDAFAAGAVATLVPVHLTRLGLSVEAIGTTMLIGALLGLGSVLAAGWAVDRSGPMRVGAGWFAVTLLALIGLGAASGATATAACFAVLLAMTRTGGTLAYALAALSRTSADRIGENFGAMMTAWALGAVVGPLSAGLGADMLGHDTTMVGLVSVAALMGIVMLGQIHRGMHIA